MVIGERMVTKRRAGIAFEVWNLVRLKVWVENWGMA
ncbi:Uncharacterised protein [Fusicatenibacter sp. 2789STDY5834925]|nr:Uncharacterised protein [Fusicatenibacter sp. 2789STDY5834925]